MDERAVAVLSAQLRSRLNDIDRIVERIRARGSAFAGSPEGVDSMAYQLHNLYGACEQLLEEVARAFENQVDPAQYHTGLLRRMGLRIEGVRPPLLSVATADVLDELRRFRRLFRHAYATDLEPARVADLADRVPPLRERIARDLERFLAQLGPG